MIITVHHPQVLKEQQLNLLIHQPNLTNIQFPSTKTMDINTVINSLPRASAQQKASSECFCGNNWADSSHVAVTLPCSHTFGQDCLRQWFNTPGQRANNRCPVCRHELFDDGRPTAEQERAELQAVLDNIRYMENRSRLWNDGLRYDSMLSEDEDSSGRLYEEDFSEIRNPVAQSRSTPYSMMARADGNGMESSSRHGRVLPVPQSGNTQHATARAGGNGMEGSSRHGRVRDHPRNETEAERSQRRQQALDQDRRQYDLNRVRTSLGREQRNLDWIRAQFDSPHLTLSRAQRLSISLDNVLLANDERNVRAVIEQIRQLEENARVVREQHNSRLSQTEINYIAYAQDNRAVLELMLEHGTRALARRRVEVSRNPQNESAGPALDLAALDMSQDPLPSGSSRDQSERQLREMRNEVRRKILEAELNLRGRLREFEFYEASNLPLPLLS
ncbi:unnamed protein product [Periconia digitata]|uniref:RING-type domain-containing protein n=1 Tax=Periconia digitata TaxID=1303443 RepID=A0A9W4UL76_9PLEO|nr:unnamed protein product [Periconia digitata]